MISYGTLVASDPYADRATYFDNPGKGKGKGHPVTPEPAYYGLLLLGFCILCVVAARFSNRRKS
jgi:hypothetical protein